MNFVDFQVQHTYTIIIDILTSELFVQCTTNNHIYK